MASKAKPRIFLDSNVIFSGLYSPEGSPGVILEHFVKGNLSIFISRQVLDEVIRTMKEKLPGAITSLGKLLVNAPPEIVADPKPQDIQRWTGLLQPGDAAVSVAALAAKPDYFCTGDKHFLDNSEITEKTGLSIVTPAQFLESWIKRTDDEV